VLEEVHQYSFTKVMFPTSENLTEKVILNLTDCDSLSNHITTKTTDEKVISLTKSDTLSNQYDVLGAAEHAPAYSDEFGTCGVKFSMGDNVPTLVSLQHNEYSRCCLVQIIHNHQLPLQQGRAGHLCHISRHGIPIVMTKKFSKWKIM
jgi:hypothetical protein